MSKLTRPFCALLCAFLAFLWLPAQAQESVGICYQVSGGANEITILGSIHIGDEAMYPMGSHITDALERADILAYECDTTSAEAQLLSLRAITYPIGETLEDHLTPETFDLVESAAEALGYPISMFNGMRPYSVVSLLSLETISAQWGADASNALAYGVENQVRALAGDKPVVYLETTQEQLDMLAGFSDELQDELVRQSCLEVLLVKEGADFENTVADWPRLWREGDAEAFAASVWEDEGLDGELMAEYYDAVLTQRNLRMAQRLCQWLEDGEGHSYFVVVGLLHLVLEEGSVLKHLEDSGYTVTRVVP